jgi:signal transduction histidine kinase
MRLLDPDILAEANGLHVAVPIVSVLIGVMLWLLGWWGHRFWIVLVTTVVAGVAGLSASNVTGMQPLVVALLLSVAAGVLALYLSRLVVFAATGLGAWLMIHSAIPALQEPLIVFLIGGLLGLLLFRFWTMVLTSFTGTLLIGYGGLLLAGKFSKLNPESWADKNGNWLNWAVVGMVFGGWLVQFLLERRRLNKLAKKQEEEEKARQKEKEKEKEKAQKEKEKSKTRTWWSWARDQFRKAG